MDGFVNPFRAEIVEDPTAPIRVRRFRARRQRLFLIIGLFILLSAPVVMLTARPAYRKFKYWRATRLVSEAEALIHQDAWSAAAKKTHAAYLLAPTNPRALHTLAEIFTYFRSPRAMDFWELAVAANPESLEDRRALIKTALVYKQIEIAQKNATILLQQSPVDRENVLLVAQVARTLNDYVGELKVLADASARWPQDTEIRFLLDRVTLQVGSDADIASALARIRDDAHRKDQVGLDALDVLATRAPADFPDRDALAELLRSHPKAGAAQLMQASALEIQAHPSRKAECLDRLIEEVRNRDAASLSLVAGWLVEIGELERALLLLPWENAQKSEELTLIHLNALVRLKRTAEMEQALATQGLVLRPAFQEFYRWQAAAAGGSESSNDRAARQAIEAAVSQPDSLAYMAPRFEEFGRTDLAEQVYTTLQGSAHFRTIATLGLLRLAHVKGDTKAILALLRQAQEDGSTEITLKGDIAHHELLLSKNVELNREVAAALVAEHPERVTFQSTLALAYLRAGSASTAMKVFEACGFQWTRANAAMRAVYAATLGGNGRDQEAAEVAKSIKGQTLLPEERELVKKYF